MPKIEISVAMIFKNEIRCLERCLKSLQPLRERFSAELVMADTGSTDGSRAVAERYADVLFDFPWINDFSAARNATLDRCSGDWVLVMDCDEWLDPGLDELERIVRGSLADDCDGASVLVRNYFTAAMDYYNDFPIIRLIRMKDRPRYSGAIHESWGFPGRKPRVYLSRATILHHDGYIMINDGSESGREKNARNVKLLREELRREPDDPRRMMQILEAGYDEPDYEELLRKALALKKRLPRAEWRDYGPIFYRMALLRAYKKELPEWETWRDQAFAEFPQSYYMGIDGNYIWAADAVDKGDAQTELQRGEAYLRACEKFRSDPLSLVKTRYSALTAYNDSAQNWIRIKLAMTEALKLKRPKEAVKRLAGIVWTSVDETQIEQTLSLLAWCCAEAAEGWERALLACWKGIAEEKPSAARAAVRRGAFLAAGARIFSARHFYNEPLKIKIDNPERPPRDLFLPLAGMCVLGDAAALARCATAEEAESLLARVENLRELPAAALIHALKTGARFPFPGRLLTTDDMDALALKLAEDPAFLRSHAVSVVFAAKTPQEILWARSLSLAALRFFDGAAEAERWPLVCAFARAQSLFLPLCYGGGAAEREEYLPTFYRFGLHLANALAVLAPPVIDSGFVPRARSANEAVAELRLALHAAPEYKPVVRCVLDRL